MRLVGAILDSLPSIYDFIQKRDQDQQKNSWDPAEEARGGPSFYSCRLGELLASLPLVV